MADKKFANQVINSKLGFIGRILLFSTICYLVFIQTKYGVSLLPNGEIGIITFILGSILVITVDILFLLVLLLLVFIPKIFKYVLTGSSSFDLYKFFKEENEEEDLEFFTPYFVLIFLYMYIFSDWRKTYKNSIELDNNDPDIHLATKEVEKFLKEKK